MGQSDDNQPATAPKRLETASPHAPPRDEEPRDRPTTPPVFEPLDRERVSAALLGGPAVERFSSEVEEEVERPDLYLGTVLDERYRVDAVIGEGGMGRVYVGRHQVIEKQVAIKILHADLARDKEAVGRFVREARAASSIGNPHIIDISDFGETPDGSTYFVMEYLEGPTLADLLDEQVVLPPELCIHLGRQMCAGLAAAHEQSIIHRDLKPDNIMIVDKGDSRGFVKILDFGIAKVSGPTSGTKLTIAGAVFGTPHYMSPEQAAGTNVDHRADIYSLGILLYEMACGELPFDADNFMGILTQHMYRPPPSIRSRARGGDCPPALEAIILRCLAKRPSARYPTMQDLGADLERVALGDSPLAVTDPTTESALFSVPAEFLSTTGAAVLPGLPVAPKRNMGLRVATGVGLGLVIGTGAFLLIHQRSDRGQAAPVVPPPTVSIVTPGPRMVLLHSPTPGAVARFEEGEVPLPANLEIPDDGLSVVIEAPGYRAATVEIAGDEGKIEVPLLRDGPVETGPRRVKPRPRKAIEGVVDPWPTD